MDKKELNYSNNEGNQKKYREHLTCSPSTKKMITKDCIREFIEHHPEMKGAKITHNHILRQIAEHYLRSP